MLLGSLYPFGVQLNVVQNATGPAPHLSYCAPNFLELRKGEVRLLSLLGTGMKIALRAAHFHGFGVARQRPWTTWVNKGRRMRCWEKTGRD